MDVSKFLFLFYFCRHLAISNRDLKYVMVDMLVDAVISRHHITAEGDTAMVEGDMAMVEGGVAGTCLSNAIWISVFSKQPWFYFVFFTSLTNLPPFWPLALWAMNLKVNDVDILSWGFYRDAWFELSEIPIMAGSCYFFAHDLAFSSSVINKQIGNFFFLGQSMVWLVVRSTSQACAFQTWGSWVVLFWPFLAHSQLCM